MPYKKNGIGGCQLVPTLNGNKKGSNKNYSKLNFVQKSPQVRMSVTPWIGTRGLESLIWFLYGTETANYIQFRAPVKNTHYFNKSFK